MVCYGAADAANEKNKILSTLKLVFGFGLMFPPFLIMQSKSFIGINMLKIGDDKPQILQRCLHNVMQWYRDGILKPHVEKVFNYRELPEAHEFLESRKSIGKVVVTWMK